MALGLGNNLIRNGGSLNPDGLSLDLQFATDKTLTARKGPTPVFIRASTATYFAPSAINAVFTHSGDAFDVNTTQLTLSNGRYSWQNGDTRILYNGSRWVLSQDGETVATSALAENAWRPDLADWSGTGAVVTATGEFGIVRSAVNEPRFDHDPLTLACKGLLIEEARTNLLQRSEEFDNAFWAKTQVTVGANSVTSPDGSVTADKIIENTANNIHRVTASSNATAGTVYSASVYAKADGRRYLYLNAGGFGSNSTFDLQTGTVVATQNGTASITNVGNGWYRCVTIGTAPTTQGAGVSLQLNTTAVATDSTYTGDGTSGILVWGAQLEAGSFPTSYIPTTTAALARSADVCSITGANFTSFWNTNEGAMFTSGDPRGSGTSSTLLMANSGANSNQISFDRTPTVIKFGIANSGTYTVSIQQNSANASFVKIAGSYATNDARSALNGTLGTPDTSVIVPTNLVRFNIGSAGLAGQEFANGCIFAIRYFRKPLSNAKLQTLTA